jgi:hypothetical protein
VQAEAAALPASSAAPAVHPLESSWQVTQVHRSFSKKAITQLLPLNEEGLLLSLSGGQDCQTYNKV